MADQGQDFTKTAWTSTTIQVNAVIAAAVESFPWLGHWIGLHPQSAILLCTLLNIGMRHVSSLPITYRKKTP